MALIDQRARARLANPPGGVGREFVAAAPVEFLDRAHQADIAFLDQIHQRQAAIDVAARDPGDQPQIGRDHLLLGALRIARAALQIGDQRAEGGQRLAGLAATGSSSSTDLRAPRRDGGGNSARARPAGATPRRTSARARRLDIALEEHAAVDPRWSASADQPALALDDLAVELLQPQRQLLDPVGMEDDDGSALPSAAALRLVRARSKASQHRAKQLGLERRQRCGLLVDPGSRASAATARDPAATRAWVPGRSMISRKAVLPARNACDHAGDRLAQQRAAMQRSPAPPA